MQVRVGFGFAATGLRCRHLQNRAMSVICVIQIFRERTLMIAIIDKILTLEFD